MWLQPALMGHHGITIYKQTCDPRLSAQATLPGCRTPPNVRGYVSYLTAVFWDLPFETEYLIRETQPLGLLARSGFHFCSGCHLARKAAGWGVRAKHLSGTRASPFCLDIQSRRRFCPPCLCRRRTCPRSLWSNLQTRRACLHGSDKTRAHGGLSRPWDG